MGQYIGVDGVARKVQQPYVGVDGVARKVKTGYVGVNSVARKTFGGSLPAVGTALNDCTWEEIAAISDSGRATEYFSIGDTKTIALNGKVVDTTYTDYSVDAYIIGIDHNSALEGSNRIHFQIGIRNGKVIALTSATYGYDTATGGFCMNQSANNSNGWGASYMRNTILGNSGTPSAPLSNSLMAALPEDLRAVMKSVAKRQAKNYTVLPDSPGTIEETTDYLFLLSEYEWSGTRVYSPLGEESNQVQYDYYRSFSASKWRPDDAYNRYVWWWCRSVYYATTQAFTAVTATATGGRTTQTANLPGGLAPCFCV